LSIGSYRHISVGQITRPSLTRLPFRLRRGEGDDPRNNHDFGRRRQLISVAKAINPRTAVVALSFGVPPDRSDLLRLCEERINDRGEDHPTLKASGAVRRVLHQFSKAFVPVRAWPRAGTAIAAWPTQDLEVLHEDYADFLIDADIVLDSHANPEAVLAAAVAGLQPVLAQLDRFRTIDLTTRPADGPTTLSQSSRWTPRSAGRTGSGHGGTSGHGLRPCTPSASAAAGQSQRMLAALRLDDDTEALDMDDLDDDVDFRSEGSARHRTSAAASPVWTTPSPSRRSPAHGKRTHPRYYAIQLEEAAVSAIFGRTTRQKLSMRMRFS